MTKIFIKLINKPYTIFVKENIMTKNFAKITDENNKTIYNYYLASNNKEELLELLDKNKSIFKEYYFNNE